MTSDDVSTTKTQPMFLLGSILPASVQRTYMFDIYVASMKVDKGVVIIYGRGGGVQNV